MKQTGELLKKVREEKRLSLHEVALFLKINSRVLQAIEDGDQSQLPARTFLRGFIQSYAKFLKLDPQAVLQIFTEETSPPAPAPSLATIEDASKTSSTFEASRATEEKPTSTNDKAEIDVISLEKSILSKSQVAQDKLGLKTIAVSIVGLFLVFILYFANSVVKKYQKEAKIEPVDSVATSTNQGENLEPTEEAPTALAEEPAATKAAETKPSTPTPPTTPMPNISSIENSAHTNAQIIGSPLISPITLPTAPKVEPKPKLPEVSTVKPIEKPVTPKPAVLPAPTPAPTAAPAIAAAAPVEKPAEKPLDKKVEPKAEGKLVEVIVEANDAVEIEYSSLKTNPQKMILKAEQIHTFKSRSGVKLKISNGGAVNIIMNGRDLGVPGAAGQPVQVTY